MASYNFGFAAIVALSILACNCRADLIDDFCAQSENSTLCSGVFRSDPRSKSGLTYNLLGEIAIERTQQLAEEVSDVARSVETTTNKVATEFCVKTLHVAIGLLEGSKNFLSFVKDKETQKALEVQVLAAWGTSVSCNSEFSVIPQPPPLKQASKNFEDLIHIIRLIISKLA